MLEKSGFAQFKRSAAKYFFKQLNVQWEQFTVESGGNIQVRYTFNL